MKSPEVIFSPNISNDVLATDVSQMYSIFPNIEDWNIDYSIGKFINQQRIYSIENKTINTQLEITALLPNNFLADKSLPLIINPKEIQELTIVFSPDASLINSEDVQIKITVSPVITDVVKI